MRDALGVHHLGRIVVRFLHVLPEISSPLVDLSTVTASVTTVRAAQVDFFEMADNRGRLSVGLGTLSAFNPSSRHRSEVHSTYN